MTAPYKYKYEPWTKICSSDDWTVSALDFLGGRKGLTLSLIHIYKIADTAGQLREQAKDLPVNAKYALYHGKTQVSEGRCV